MDTNFRIDKSRVLDKFREYISTHSTKEDEFANKSGKQVPDRSRYIILDKVKSLYSWVLEQIKLDLRRTYIHNDAMFAEIYNSLQNYVNNKIRSTTDGQLHLNVNNKYTFNGEHQQYEDYLVINKNKTYDVMKNVIDELNNVLAGQAIEDEGKPILRDISEEETVEVDEELLDEIAEEILDEIGYDGLVGIMQELTDEV